MILLRPATLNDIPMLEHWDKQQHVIDCDPEDDWNWHEELTDKDPYSEKLVAEFNGKAIGFVQIIDPANERTHYWGNVAENLRAIDVWIGEAENLNKGFGTQMMQAALARCFAHKDVTAVLIDPLASNTAAIRFYKRIGFEFVEKRVFNESPCEVYQFERSTWERSQFD
jgi:aminoglycoside 6'-N-acetyltransferase